MNNNKEIVKNTTEQPYKCYEINLSKIAESYFYDEITCYAHNINQAKSILLNDVKYYNMKLYDFNEITYLNIPVVRRKYDDLILFEGEYITDKKKNKILSERKYLSELDVILDEPNIQYCYIKKNGQYYKPFSSGYTDFNHRAGVFTKQKAVSSAKMCGELDIIPINIIEHNKMINDEILDLTTRLL